MTPDDQVALDHAVDEYMILWDKDFSLVSAPVWGNLSVRAAVSVAFEAGYTRRYMEDLRREERSGGRPE